MVDEFNKNGSLWIEGYHGYENICVKNNRYFIENIAAFHSMGFKFSEKYVPSLKSDMTFLKNLLCCSKTCQMYELSKIDNFEFEYFCEDGYKQITQKIDALFMPKTFANHRIQIIPSKSELAFCEGFYKINYLFVDIETECVLETLTLIYEIPSLYTSPPSVEVEFSVDKTCLVVRDNIIRIKKTPKFQVTLDENFACNKKGYIRVLSKFVITTEENLLCDFLKEICVI